MARQAAHARVQQYIMARPGTVTTVADVVAELEIPSSTASTCLRRLADDATTGVRGTGQRGVYLYTGRARALAGADTKPIPIGTLLECIGQAAAGKPMVRDESGVVYIASPVQ